MKISAKITDTNPAHTRLSIWVNGGLITNPGGICLRNKEVPGFLDHLRISPSQIKIRILAMIEAYKKDDGRDPMLNLEKRVALQIVLDWIDEQDQLEIPVTEALYPSDWPRCPGCGQPALDGHITCGDVRCGEGSRR